MSDYELLQRYARTGDQAAFTELVARHLNLVYSAARRQVRPPQLAEEVTQSVFLDLARRARDFPSGQPLAPWLHVVTRRAAVDAIRRESRRHAREQTASEIAAMHTPDSTWSHLAPLLDEAVAALPDADRTALVLRFFEQKSLREIGTALGTNEDAAQKRVSRAVDQLRALLTRRGLTVTAAGLATDLSAHAILTAPATLGATISAAALSGGAAATTITVTTLQLSLIATAITAAVGLGLYQLVSRHERAPHVPPVATLASPAFASNASAPAAPIPSANGASRRTGEDRVALLKKLFAELPAQRIPEIKLLTDSDWLDVARTHELDTTSDIRVALAEIRALARRKFADELRPALQKFITASEGQLPTDPAQLIPHLSFADLGPLLGRYHLIRTGKSTDRTEKVIQENSDSDLILSVGLDSWDLTNNPTSPAAFGENESEAIARIWRATGAALGDEMKAEMATMVSPDHVSEAADHMREVADRLMSEIDTAAGDRDGTGAELKTAVRRFIAAGTDEKLTDFSQILPYLRDSEKYVAALRTTLAHVAYLRDHAGQPPSDPAHLRPYLDKPFDADAALKELKLSWDGEHLTMTYVFLKHSVETVTENVETPKP